jgi:hypothetical protein
MKHKFKAGDKVWVKARVMLERSTIGNIHVDIDGRRVVTVRQNLRPRVKRKLPASPWQPIETAPKDGTPILLRRVNAKGVPCFYVAWHFMGEWTTGTHTVFDPTHYMPIPKLEVDDV